MSKENKPRWKSLNMYETIERLCQKGREKEDSKEDCD